MQPEKLSKEEKHFLHKRVLIKSVTDSLKNEGQIEQTRHRSLKNFPTNLWTGIIAYEFLDKKPSLQDYKQEIKKN